MCAHVRYERRLVLVFLCERNLPVTAVAVQRGEYRRFTEAIEAIVCPRERIRIRNRRSVELPVVNAETPRPIRFGSKNHRACPLRVAGLDHPLLKHLVDCFLCLLTLVEALTVGQLTDWLRPGLKLNAVFGHVNLAEVAGVPHSLVT